jgi:hypothetical protein
MVKYRKILRKKAYNMDKDVLNYVVEKTNELISAPSCSSEAKEAAQNWLAAIGTDREAAETKKYIDELEADILPIDSLIGFAGSDAGIQVFGADTAKHITAHAIEIKSAGEKYCDCPACAAVAAILNKKDDLLK